MKELDRNKALVIFSGGQDSTTILAWALKRWGAKNVDTLTFRYGQRHDVEITASKKVFESFFKSEEHSDSKYHLLNVDAMRAIGDSGLINMSTNLSETKDGLPKSFVPGRNIIFLTHGAQLAYSLGYKNLVTGVCQTDFSGYPDCRAVFISSLQTTLSLGMDTEILIHTPLMYLNKAETWLMAERLECLEEIMLSHTCYEGDETPNEWGKGCGICPSCKLRKNGFYEYKKIKGKE